MYRVEIFDEQMDFVSACYTDDAQTVSIDYLAYDPFQITVQAIEAKKGYFAHITGRNNELVADCVIADVQPDKEQQELSLRPLQALFDVGVFYSPVSDAITWIGNNLTDQFVTNADTLQRRPLNITATAGSRSFPLTGYNLNPTINILSVITNAFATWGIVTEAYLDLSEKEIVVNIYEQVAEQTIECDLDNIISAEITLGDSYGSTNKLTIRKTVEEGTPTGTTEITYYRHTDGSINTTDDDRIVPVFWEVATIEQTSDMTDAQWIQETFTKAKEVLSVGHYDNEVILSVWEDDKIINPKSIEIGTIVTLLLKGETYYSILTGYQVEGSIYTLTFGAVRTELTKKLSIQNRGSSSSSSSSGGGGGGGGGAVTGVKGNEEILYRVGDVNLTPADIGSVPTTTTINGYPLSSNVTITKADVGLGNVDNTADLDKPISDAVQSALDDKVDKETGKGLSTNDFTNALLTKLNGIEAGAQVNTVTGVKGNSESSYRVGNVNITKANIGLGNVDNTSDANKPISTATQTALDNKVDKVTGKGLSTNDFTDALLTKLNGIESGAQVNTVTGVKGNSESTYRTGNINITKANIGLGNVDNTSDANKPISTATQTALDGKVDVESGKGLSANDFTDALLTKLNGIESGAQVNTITGVKGNAESSYRTGNVNLTKANIGLGNVDNTSDANKPISTATQTALDGKVNTTDIATTSDLGLVMPDGTSITIDADGTIHSVGGGGGGGASQEMLPLLWTNPSPSSSFSAQTVSLDLSAYCGVVVVTKYVNTSSVPRRGAICLKGLATGVYEVSSGTSYEYALRTMTVTDTGIDFATAYYKTNTNNNYEIPWYIYGIPKQIGGAGAITYFESQTTSVASNAEILRITDSSITTATIVLECTFANPSAISGDVSWTSYNGYIAFTGTCTSATTANVTLADKTN